jgi:type II secretory pathway pseudopilin PulG
VRRNTEQPFGGKRASRAFSLVEVVLALGIFSFAIVAIIALFGGVSKNTRSLVDRDATVAVWQSLSAQIAGMSSTNIFAVPSGTGDSGRPELFARVVQPGGSTNAVSVEVESAATGFTNAPSDGRIYRARLYRALTPTNWAAGQAYYPLRVKVDVFAADAYASTNTPMESTALNLIWNAH